MVRIERNYDNDKVYIIGGEKGDIEVNIGTKLVLDNYSPFVCDVIHLAPTTTPTTTPTITLKVVESNKYFDNNERIKLENDSGSIQAKSLDDENKPPKVINFVKIYRRLEGQFPLTHESEQWHRDKDYDKCEICENSFRFYNRKHHCRKCGKVVCHDCSSKTYNGNRVCDGCYTILTGEGAQGGGYKHRKNKSKRKNKRSVRRRMSKRSNMRRKNKKNTKRLRKSRRRARR